MARKQRNASLHKGLDHPAMKLLTDASVVVQMPYTRLEFNSAYGETCHWVFSLGNKAEVIQVDRGTLPGSAATVNTIAWHAMLQGLIRLQQWTTPPKAILIHGHQNAICYGVSGQWGCKEPGMIEYRDRCRDILAVLGVSWASEWIHVKEMRLRA